MMADGHAIGHEKYCLEIKPDALWMRVAIEEEDGENKRDFIAFIGK